MMEKRTTENLRFLIVYAAGFGLGTKEEAIAELLRRERERCAQIADGEADQSRRLGKQGFPPEADLVAESIAERIRQLQ